MKIKTWLQIIVFFSVSIAISIGIFNGLTVSHVNNAMKKNTLAGEIVKVVNQQRNTASEYLLNHKQVTAFKWQDMYDISVKLLQSKEFKMAEEQLILEDMREDNVNVKRIFTYLVAVQERKVLGKEDIGTLLESEARLRIRLLELVESINTGAYRLSEMSHRDVKNALQRANIFIIVSVCILIVLIIFILLLFGVKIITRLSKLSQGINIIGSGNLDYRVDNKSKDEIGQIAHSFNEMTAKLKESYDRLEEKVKKLEDSEQRLNLVLDSAQMGVWDLDLINDTAIRSLRHDQIFGYQNLQPTWGAQIFLTHVVPEYRDPVKRRFEEAFKTGNFKMECQIIWPDKSLHWIAAEGRVYSDDKGDPVRMMGVVLDITGRKVVELERMQNQQFLENQTKELKSQQRAALNVLEDIKEARALLEKSSKDLLRSNKELEQFAYVASHDLQEPLRMVASFCQKLEKGYKDQLDENAKQYIHFAVDGSKRMQLLVDSLLSFARVGFRLLANASRTSHSQG